MVAWSAIIAAHYGSAPGLEPRARQYSAVLKRRWVVEVGAALGLPLPTLGAVAVAALGAAFDLGGGELRADADLVGLDLSDRALVALGGLPAALAQPPGDHDPVALRE
jgi:hypothetical protein